VKAVEVDQQPVRYCAIEKLRQLITVAHSLLQFTFSMLGGRPNQKSQDGMHLETAAPPKVLAKSFARLEPTDWARIS
jgi:hypothetical protein